jgi:excinuclease UvrABC ATPase subunit
MRYMPSTWIPCAACGGARFSDEVLSAVAAFGNGAAARDLSIADFYALPIRDAAPLLLHSPHLPAKVRRVAQPIIQALEDIGLGYLTLGQPSPTLSGGEAQRVSWRLPGTSTWKGRSATGEPRRDCTRRTCRTAHRARPLVRTAPHRRR